MSLCRVCRSDDHNRTVIDYQIRLNFLPLFFIISCLLLSPGLVEAAETLIVQIDVNHVTKGEYFVIRDDEGYFSLQRNDLEALGLSISDLPAETQLVPLSAFKDIEWQFNELSLSLSLRLPTGMLPPTQLDLSSKRQHDVLYPSDNSAFLNYRLGYSNSTSDESGFGAIEVGIRNGNLLFLSNHQLQHETGNTDEVRLMSSVTYDRRQELLRTVVGDYQTPSNMFGGGLRLGGITLAKRYDMNPYLIRYPLVELQGSVATPSEIDIYQNGMLLRTEKVTPGDFSVANLDGMGGFGEIDLVIRDIYGRETRMSRPYYLSDQLLDRGRHEYSYSVGALRHEFGVEDNHYRTIAVTGQHRYGYSSNLTLGAVVEIGGEDVMVAPQALYLPGTRGLVIGNAAFSSSRGIEGQAAGLQYYYNHYPFSARIGSKAFSRSFQVLSIYPNNEERKIEIAGGIGWSDLRLGSINADVSRTALYDSESRGRVNVGYNCRLGGNLYLTMNVARTLDSDPAWSLFATLQFTSWEDIQGALRTEYERGYRSSALQMQKNQPFGEGSGYYASVGDTDNMLGGSQYLDGMFQQNGRYGIYRGEWQLNGDAYGSEHVYSLSTAGSLAWLGGELRASRPIEDSFALVQVGRLPNVTVTQNGQPVGHTDANGRVLLPSLTAFYENQIGIDDQDIPLNYGISEISRYISPSWRSGSCLSFAVNRSQPVTGRLMLRRAGKTSPVEFREIVLSSGAAEYRLPTGSGGEFYFDPTEEQYRDRAQAAPIRVGCIHMNETEIKGATGDGYQGRVIIDGKEYMFTLHPPLNDDLFIDLGEIVIDDSSHGARGE